MRSVLFVLSVLVVACALIDAYNNAISRSVHNSRQLNSLRKLDPLNSLNAKWISVQVEEEAKGIKSDPTPPQKPPPMSDPEPPEEKNEEKDPKPPVVELKEEAPVPEATTKQMESQAEIEPAKSSMPSAPRSVTVNRKVGDAAEPKPISKASAVPKSKRDCSQARRGQP